MPSLLDIPTELHHNIIRFCPGSVLKSLRATCRHLNSISSPLLYPTLYLSCHPLDLEVFELVSSNPLLISNVKELVIDDTTLAPSLTNWAAFRTIAEIERIHGPPRRKPKVEEREEQLNDGVDEGEEEGEGDQAQGNSPDLKACYDLYVSTCEAHHKNRLSHADIKAMREALPKMKSLRSLVLSNRTADDKKHKDGSQTTICSSPTVKMWRRFGNGEEMAPFPPSCGWCGSVDNPFPQDRRLEGELSSDWLRDPLAIRLEEGAYMIRENSDVMTDTSLECVGSLDDDDDNGDDYDGQPNSNTYFEYKSLRPVSRPARGLRIILEILSHPSIRSQLTEFRIDPTHDPSRKMFQAGLHAPIFTPPISPLRDSLISSLRQTPNLKKCQFAFDNIGGNWRFPGFEHRKQNIADIITSAQDTLEDLTIEVHEISPITDLLHNITFPRLRTLKLICGPIDTRQLFRFIQRHNSTLESVTLSHCGLEGEVQEGVPSDAGTWRGFVRDFKKLKGTVDGNGKAPLLKELVLDEVVSTLPWNGCGVAGNIWPFMYALYDWRYGVDEDVVLAYLSCLPAEPRSWPPSEGGDDDDDDDGLQPA
ncbi:hypothetical protein FQN54_003555 [Arachnomyces sp. PD_36]|nr:hypothetical protein FQN54_003555 [Arachnomyces sp. PD_36]